MQPFCNIFISNSMKLLHKKAFQNFKNKILIISLGLIFL